MCAQCARARERRGIGRINDKSRKDELDYERSFMTELYSGCFQITPGTEREMIFHAERPGARFSKDRNRARFIHLPGPR